MKSWDELTAGDLMTRPIIAVAADTPLSEAAKTLCDNQISGALVTDHRGASIGVISLFDIASHLAGLERPAGEPGGFYRQSFPSFKDGGEGWEEGLEEPDGAPLEEITVSEIMATEIIQVAPETPLPEVARLMAQKKIHRVFVAGRRGVQGVLSTMDVLKAVGGKRPVKVHA